MCGKHELLLGKGLPQVIDKIGGDIDFVILDTVHAMPGEGLDFLAVLPYLKAGAVVVMHDVALNQYFLKSPHANATLALFSAVTADKFLNFIPDDGNRKYVYPNIAAFQINEQTAANIENVFLTMILRWTYMPIEINLYRAHYKRHYSPELCDIFNEAIKMNSCNRALMVAPTDVLIYRTYVTKTGWSKWTGENRISNNLAQQLDIQAVKINFPDHKVYYSVYYNETEGWSKEVSNDELAGVTGKSKSIYGIRIRLDEAGTKAFDIIYRVHKFDGGWSDWAKNGEALSAQGIKLNALQIKLEPKMA